MSEPSERIRAALSRSSSAQTPLQSTPKPQPTSSEKTQSVEKTLPLIASDDKTRVGLPEETILTPVSIGISEPKGRVRLVIAAIVIAAVGAFLTRDRWLPVLKPGERVVNYPLQLEVKPQANGVVDVRWNPGSEPVKTAREGRLVIMERDLPERSVWLEPERLKIGFVSFQPTTGHIEFRLEIVDRSGQTFQESVLALASAPAPAAPAPQELPAPAPPPSVETKPQVPQVAKIQEAPQPTRPPIRTFVMPPPKPLSPDQARAVLLDSPAVAANPGLPETGESLGATRLSSTPVKAPPAPPPPPKRIKVGGNLQAANLIRKVAPVYPPVAKATRIQGTVRFTATIGKDGTIHSLQALSGPALLVQSATEAVKQWVYRPMLLNGDPVEVETQIDVTFTLGN